MSTGQVDRASDISGFSLLPIPNANISNDSTAIREFQSSTKPTVKLSNGLHSSPNNEDFATRALVIESINFEEKDSSSENTGGNNHMFYSVKLPEDVLPRVTETNACCQELVNAEEIGNRENPGKLLENLSISVEFEHKDNDFSSFDKPMSGIPNGAILYDRREDASHEKAISEPVFHLDGKQHYVYDEDFENFVTHGNNKEYDVKGDKQGITAANAKSDILCATEQCDTVPNAKQNVQDCHVGDDLKCVTLDGISDGSEQDKLEYVDKEISNVLIVCNNDSCDDDFDDFSGFKSAEPQESIKAPKVEFETDDFADFSGFQNVKAAPPPPEINLLMKNILCHVGSALEMTFSTDKRAGLETFAPSQTPPNPFKDHEFLARLWCKSSSETVENLLASLSIHPASFATKQVWNTSYTYSMYLDTIGVDIQSTHPVISSQIKLFEPTPVDHTSTSSCPAPARTAQSTDSSAPDLHWSTSGLNPDLLSAENVIKPASDADLELFERLSSKSSSSKPTGPIADLEAEFLHSVIPPPPVVQTPLPSLPKTISSKISTTPENGIPENVSNVLKLLPDFSYLRKSILAFPVSEHTE